MSFDHTNIHIVAFGPSSQPRTCFGLTYRANMPDMPPHIDLFEIRDNQTPYLASHNLLLVCKTALSYLAQNNIHHAVDDVTWAYTNSPFHADFTFEHLVDNHFHLQMNGSTLGAQPCFSAKNYQHALTHPKGLEYALTDVHGFMSPTITHIIIIHTPLHPYGHMVYQAKDSSSNELIIVDAQKFYAAWLYQSKRETNSRSDAALQMIYNYHAGYMGGDDNPVAPFHSTAADSIKHMGKPHIAHIPDIAFIDYDYRSEYIHFTNGRHRSLNMVKTGASILPVQISARSKGLDGFKQKFQYAASNVAQIKPSLPVVTDLLLHPYMG